MENSQQLATESFSYSWLTDRKPTLPENCNEREQNFYFDVPFSASPIALVHADEIFSDGHIMPLYVDRSKVEALKSSASVPSSPLRSYSLGSPFLIANKSRYYLLGKLRKSSKKILEKCFGFVKPLCKSIGCSRKSNRVDDLERKVCEVRSWSNSLEGSPRQSSSAYNSVLDWSDVKKIGNKDDLHYGLKRVKSWSSSPQASPRTTPSHSSTDVESSIHEAILYCKRSIEK